MTQKQKGKEFLEKLENGTFEEENFNEYKIEQFLNARFKGCQEWIELRMFPIDGSKIKQSWWEVGNIKRLAHTIVRNDEQQKYNIAIGTQTRSNKGARNEDVKEITCIFIDHDCENETQREVIQKLINYKLHPSCIVNSGRGVHGYWFLKEPIKADPKTVERYNETQKRLAKFFGGDNVYDVARVMRVPYTQNLKLLEKEGQIYNFDFNNPEVIKAIDEGTLAKQFEEGTLSEGAVKKVPNILVTHYDFFPCEKSEFIYRYTLEDLENVLADVTIESKIKEKHEYINTDEINLSSLPKKLIVDIRTGYINKSDIDNKIFNEEEINNLIKTSTLLKEINGVIVPSHETESELDYSIIKRLLIYTSSEELVKAVYNNENFGIGIKHRTKGDRGQYLNHTIKKVKSDLLIDCKEIVFMLRSNFDKLIIIKIREIVNQFIFSVMSFDEMGVFLKTELKGTKNYYYFSREEKELIEIQTKDFSTFISENFGILKHETDYQLLVDYIETKLKHLGELIELKKLSSFNEKEKALYIYNGKDKIFKLDGDKIQTLDYGGTEIFFKPYLVEPFKLEDAKESEGKFRKVITSKINTNTNKNFGLNHDEQMKLLEVWAYSLFLNELFPTKIILCCVGSAGSGKTTLQRNIGKVIFGSDFNVSSFTKQSDFEVSLDKNLLVVWDNLDNFEFWHQNVLAKACTGYNPEKRTLFTDKDITFINCSSCFICINAKSPHFKWQDIAERLLIFDLEKIENYISEGELFREIKKERNFILTDIVFNLNKIVKEIQKEQIGSRAEVLRVGDFSNFVYIVNQALNLGLNVDEVIKKIKYEQSQFISGVNNELLESIGLLLESNNGENINEKFTARELFENEDFNKDKKIFSSGDRIGKMLKNNADNQYLIRKYYHFEIEKGRSNRTFYKFSPKDSSLKKDEVKKSEEIKTDEVDKKTFKNKGRKASEGEKAQIRRKLKKQARVKVPESEL